MVVERFMKGNIMRGKKRKGSVIIFYDWFNGLLFIDWIGLEVLILILFKI